MNDQTFDTLIHEAREQYRGLRYEGPAFERLDAPHRPPARSRPTLRLTAGRRLGWGLAAASAALAAVLALQFASPPPSTGDDDAVATPYRALAEVRMALAGATPRAPSRPASSLFTLPPAPQRSTGFAEPPAEDAAADDETSPADLG